MKINNKLLGSTIVDTTNTNLNDYKTDGVYYFGSSYAPINRPAGSNGWLEVFTGEQGGDKVVKQIWYRHGTPNSTDYETYVRILSSGTWSNWKEYAIIESGSNSNGKYIKYGDGTMICWNSAQVTKSVSNSWGSLYVCTAFSAGTFPQTFTSTPTINIYCSGSSSVMLVTAAGPSTTSAGSIQLARGDRNTSTTTTVNYIAIGKWK